MKKILGKKEEKILKELASGGKIYTAGSSFSGGWKRAFDHTEKYIELLKFLKKKYEVGNGSPRGGLNGKFVKCRKFDYEKAKKIVEIELYRKEIEKQQSNRFIDRYFKTKSKSGKLYYGYSKPYTAETPELTARINGEELEVFINGEWKKCRK